MRQEERLSQPQSGEGPDDDVAPARLDIVRHPPLGGVLDLDVPDALLSDRGEVVVEPPVVHVVPTVGAAVVGAAAVGQRGKQLRRAVVRGVLQKKSFFFTSLGGDNELVPLYSAHEKPSSTLE